MDQQLLQFLQQSSALSAAAPSLTLPTSVFNVPGSSVAFLPAMTTAYTPANTINSAIGGLPGAVTWSKGTNATATAGVPAFFATPQPIQANPASVDPLADILSLYNRQLLMPSVQGQVAPTPAPAPSTAAVSAEQQLQLLRLLLQSQTPQQPTVIPTIQPAASSLSNAATPYALQQLAQQLNSTPISNSLPQEKLLELLSQNQPQVENVFPCATDCRSPMSRKRNHDSERGTAAKRSINGDQNADKGRRIRPRAYTNPFPSTSTVADQFTPEEVAKYRSDDPDSPYRHHPVNQVRKEHDDMSEVVAMMYLINYPHKLNDYLEKRNITMEEFMTEQKNEHKLGENQAMEMDDDSLVDRKTGLVKLAGIQQVITKHMHDSIKADGTEDVPAISNATSSAVPLAAS